MEYRRSWNGDRVVCTKGGDERKKYTVYLLSPWSTWQRNGGGNVTISSRGFRQASPFNGTEWVFNGKYYVKSLVNGGQWQDSIIQILNTSIRHHRVLKPHCVVRQKACDKRGVISVDYMMRYDERDGKFIQGNWANFVETDERMKGGHAIERTEFRSSLSRRGHHVFPSFLFFFLSSDHPFFSFEKEDRSSLSNRFWIVLARSRRVIWWRLIGNYLCVQSKRLLSFVNARDDC